MGGFKFMFLLHCVLNNLLEFNVLTFIVLREIKG